ncbi:acyltransferase family protein [Larsenimonas rhizosphaerae]|uniref:Acyltransferase family protein n=1 Tax=Larsenimonas rhizosphaerae TaxID=2944682 RepID=A0AA41ZKR4_9GAMM|nr:acyltransferase family protein [Larsenimonas rhizosphaerae]MCM2130854.1 acyltransferase family protein [Larsenimonas rhizosphaerae]MCX2523558.1 acyltransferase family protein [Larsenimonas rhizosphaerae]
MSVDAKGRMDWIDAAKGVCIVLVVLYHAVYFMMDASTFNQTLAHKVWYNLVIALKPLRMPLFFLISGLLAHSAIVKRSWGDSIRPRLYLMLWLYVLWYLARTVTAWLLAHYANTAAVPNAGELPAGPGELLSTILNGTNGVWYLYALAIYFVAFKLMRRYGHAAVLVSLMLSIFSISFIHNWGIKGIAENAFFFAVGCFYREQLLLAFREFSLKRFLCFSTLTCLLLPTAAYYDWLYVPGGRTLLAIFMVLAGLDFFCLVSRYLSLKTTCYMGRNTLPIYVMHKMTILLTCQLVLPFAELGLYSELSAAVLPIIATAVNIAVCLGVYRLLNQGAGKGLFSLPQWQQGMLLSGRR